MTRYWIQARPKKPNRKPNPRFKASSKITRSLKMLENSLHDGALYRCRLQADNEMDTDRILEFALQFLGSSGHTFSRTLGENLPLGHDSHTALELFRWGTLWMPSLIGIASTGIPTDWTVRGRSGTVTHPLCSWTDGYWNFAPSNQRKVE